MAETSNRAGEKGTIVQIIGAVVDVEFPEGHIPELYDALQVKGDGKTVLTLSLRYSSRLVAALFAVSPWVHQTAYQEVLRL